MNNTRRFALPILLTLLSACDGADAPAEQAPEAAVVAAPAAPEQGMGNMQGMGEMPGMQMNGGMMADMQAHMQRMEGTSADNMMVLMPMHRQMAANMLAQMNREMREMNMAADPQWDETVSALRQDLTRMPEMTAAELQALMPEHRARVMRLMEMHRTMMADMAM